jgi:hypothetical protein
MPRTKRNWTSQSPYERFFDFIAPEADRFAVLLDHIQKLGLNSLVISIEGNRHFFIFPKRINLKLSPGSAFPFHGENPIVLTAHYDRVPGSPGANDNSAAVFQLLKTALKLDEMDLDCWIIIFTDKEELQSGEGFKQQGSYSLAKKLRRLGLLNAQIFNFDACGSGEVFVFSGTTDYLLDKNEKPGFRRVSQRVKKLRTKVLETARKLNISHVLSVPTPFSDDAGFLQGGLPAQTITMLPVKEASHFASLLRNHPEFIDLLISGSLNTPEDRQNIPETWRSINCPEDTPARLTPEHYDRVVRFAVELCKDES